jgi:ATP-dependent DNA helicase RecG
MNKENQNIEWKESWRDEFLKTLSAFANSEGGTLLLGINDSGDVVGLKNTGRLLEDIPNKIINKLGLIPNVRLESKNNLDYISVYVSSSNYPIPFEGRFYKRSGSTTQEIKGTELQSFLLSKIGKSWDSLINQASIDDLDSETINLYKTLSKERLPSISQLSDTKIILENLNLLVDDKLTNAAVLLFGKNPRKFIPNTETRVGRFLNDVDILDTILIDGNLIQQLNKATEAIKKHLKVRFEIKENERHDVWDYPLPAIREALMNALIHKDYQVTGDIQIRIYDNKIWFYNPGLLPYPMTIDKLKSEHGSFPRNKLLAMTFYYAGFIEKWGSGTLRIINQFKEISHPEPDFKEDLGGFNVYFYKDKYNEEQLKKFGLNERMMTAILFTKENGKITNKDYQKLNSCGRNTASNELKELVENGLFKESGKKGAGAYYVIAQ